MLFSTAVERISRRLAVEQGFDEERRKQLVERYFAFLSEAALSDAQPRPYRDVDDLWHRHILETRDYAEDCARWFGRFIHHRSFSPEEAAAGVPPHGWPEDGGARADCSPPAPPDPPASPWPGLSGLADCGPGKSRRLPLLAAEADRVRADCGAGEKPERPPPPPRPLRQRDG